MSMPLSTPVAERELEVRNPATGERIGSVPIATPEEVQAAVARARVAQIRWARQSVTERAALLRRYHDLVLDRADDILDTIQKESGKARRDALLDVLSVAGTARYYAVRGKRFLAGHRGRGAAFGITSARVVYKPYGVVGIISPWNFPFLLAIGDALPALLAGNAVVLKPSELTPFSAELGRRLLLECGLDADLFQIVQGRGDVGSGSSATSTTSASPAGPRPGARSRWRRATVDPVLARARRQESHDRARRRAGRKSCDWPDRRGL